MLIFSIAFASDLGYGFLIKGQGHYYLKSCPICSGHNFLRFLLDLTECPHIGTISGNFTCLFWTMILGYYFKVIHPLVLSIWLRIQTTTFLD